MEKMVTIIVKFTVNNERKFKPLISELIEASQKEEGCIEYALHKDTKDAFVFVLFERWKDEEAVAIHNETEHFKKAVPLLLEVAEVEMNVCKAVSL